MAQNYEIDIMRFNGQDYDTLFPTPAAHAATHEVGGSDPITIQTGNIADGAVTNEKIADNAVDTGNVKNGSVTRSKLANDALYSPVVRIASGTTYVTVEHLGETLATSYYPSPADFVIEVTLENSRAMPVGQEIALLWKDAKSVTVSFTGNMYVGIRGGGNGEWLINPTLKMVERFDMIAMKKIGAETDKNYWIVTGNVEVVS